MSSPDNTRRHWHGDPGARHEHLNVWTHGGAKGPAVRAPWALTPEMMATGTRRVSRRLARAVHCSPAQSYGTARYIKSSPTQTHTVYTGLQHLDHIRERRRRQRQHQRQRQQQLPTNRQRAASLQLHFEWAFREPADPQEGEY